MASTALEPAFRLPAGGRPLAPPLVDATRQPAVAWMLSEDRTVYALSEEGGLIARIPLGAKPAPFLSLDPAGRVLTVTEAGAGQELKAWTRSGSLAWSARLEGGAPAFPPAFGADGRLFLLDGSALRCLSQSGRPLWRRELGGRPSAAPATDGAGQVLVSLDDGGILLVSAWGEELGRLAGSAATAATALSPFAAAAPRSLEVRPLWQAAGGAASSGRSAPDGFMPLGAAGLRDGRVLLLDGSGRVLAEPRVGAAPISALASDGAVLYALDEGGRLAALAGSGVVLWKSETGLQGGKLSLYAERVVATGKGRAVSLSSLGETWRAATLTNAAAPGAPAPSGLLFSPGEDWILAAWRFEKPLGQPRLIQPPAYGRSRAAVEEAKTYDPRIADYGRQLELLADIEKKVESGTIGAEEEASAALAASFALAEFDAPGPQAQRRFRGNPLPRARACALLGAIGSPEDRGSLIEVLLRDTEPAVRAAACEALGSIAADPDGLVGKAFLEAARKADPPLEERVAYAVIEAMESMALRSGAPPTVEGVRALLALAGKPFGSAVRDRASRALGRIAGALGQ